MTSARIAILTPDRGDEAFETRWDQVFDRNVAALRDAGFTVEGRSWTEAQDLTGFDLVMPLLVWGYVRDHRAWLDAVEAWRAAGVRLQNPPSALAWNSRKTYLSVLAERGAPVVPALFFDRLTADDLEAAAIQFGSDRLVAKPQVSHGAWQTIRWSPGEPLEGGPEGSAIVQPYLAGIETDGEISLLYFGGRLSHAIRKRPQPGDFRVQPEQRGIITPHRPEADEIAAAERVLASIEEDLLYARIDLVRGSDDAPALIEIELIEPDLYLGFDPSQGRLFAEAVRKRLSDLAPSPGRI
jgi:glutathione synthase/RimK-type ligase-like ATP-grasp enzyme